MSAALLLAACCLGAAPTASPAVANSFVEVAYSDVSVDYKPFPDFHGERLLGQLGIGRRIELFGSYSTADFWPSGPVLGQYARAEDWIDAGARYALYAGDTLRLSIAASSQSVKLDQDRKYGHALHAGLRWTPWPFVQLDLDIAKMDLVIKDVRSSATLAFRLTKSLALTARVIDHSDWDLTFYEGGLRWSFGGIGSAPATKPDRASPAPADDSAAPPRSDSDAAAPSTAPAEARPDQTP